MNIKYKEQAKYLSSSIDIAITAFEKFPSQGLTPEQMKYILNSYNQLKSMVLYPAPEFENLKSLKFLINDILEYFQQNEGEVVDFFWAEIYRSKLPYKREDRLSKILKRKKIRNDIEYNFITDILGISLQNGTIDNQDMALINNLISEYENRKVV